MRLVVVTALAALLLPTAALAAGPSYVAKGGLGVLSHDGKYRFVAVSDGREHRDRARGRSRRRRLGLDDARRRRTASRSRRCGPDSSRG